jgi:hypothetical protein
MMTPKEEKRQKGTTMCIMEIHAHSARTTMVQAIAHNLSTIDRDLDMLLQVAQARKDGQLKQFARSVQDKVHRAYADALVEFGIEVENLASDPDGHVHVGNERTVVELVHNATTNAKRDETR